MPTHGFPGQPPGDARRRPNTKLKLRILRADRTPLEGATVFAFLDPEKKFGAGGATCPKGIVELPLGKAVTRIHLLQIRPRNEAAYHEKHDITLRSGDYLILPVAS
jgi:hypothetical protein